ncbi:kinesin motor protein cin8 [Borealophlyctis nickersoniae]|nr:kinesin motor protein cin8 [Borealophlyctis nickersoniae]
MSSRDVAETNITVVVRLRPRNAKEIKENSPVAVTATGAHLHVKMSSSEVTSKTYTFDKVFGPEADQTLIFDDVVVPILDEVRMGYNCTIFAYGQTGAGKTYTMEGDLEAGRGLHAGIIPRTLYSLFDALERETAEYSVRVSYIELYNEELKDLLSSEDDFRKLRIYEDLSRKGSVVVQGMEELLVKNAADVISVLQKGANKRQIASTKMNEVSSRSHCIFSITVHMKESTPDGEELLKVGKLNLVDLAGSENIGRSGARAQRAVEAGMINQSLLTLGRVINALVDRSPHIPYRESKLTRLLQDSLVSPAKSNLEETTSTLEYAHRAKNIRNKPEVNQKMTKKALIREYINEIERLKADLQATREKNGIFLTPETYNTLVDENQGRKDRLQEVSKDVLAKEERLKHLEEKFRSQMELLHDTSSKLDAAMEELEEKKQEVERAMDEMKVLQQSLAEQKVLTDAHAYTEKKLNSLAAGLVSTLRSSVNDVEGLHQKLDRKSAVEMENMGLFQQFQNILLSEMSELETRMVSFSHITEQFLGEVAGQMGGFMKQQAQEWDSSQALVSSQMDQLSNRSGALLEGVQTHDREMTKELEEIVTLARGLKSAVKERERKSKRIHGDMFAVLREVVAKHQTEMQDWNATLKSYMTDLVQSVKAHVAQQIEHQRRVQKGVEESMQQEISALRAQNANLQQTLANHRQTSTQSRDALLADVNRLLTAYTAQQDEAVERIVSTACENGDRQTKRLHTFTEAEQRNMEGSVETQLAFVEKLMGGAGTMQEEMDAGAKAMDETVCGFAVKCNALETSVVDLIGGTAMAVDECVDNIEHRQQTTVQMSNTFGATHSDNLSILDQTTRNAFGAVNSKMVGMRDHGEEQLGSWQEKLAEQSTTTGTLGTEAISVIARTKNEINCKRLAEDEPTGKTPRKRVFRFPQTWEVTPSHDEILRKFREHGATGLRRPSPPEGFSEFDRYVNGNGFDEDGGPMEHKENGTSNEWDDESGEDMPSSAPTPIKFEAKQAPPTPAARSKLPRTRSRHITTRRRAESGSVDSPMTGMDNVLGQ